MIKLGGKTNRSVIHKVINSVWKKKELPEEWKEAIIVSVYNKGDKTDCNNCRGFSFWRTKYSVLSNILLSRLTPHAEKDHQCGFRCNR